MRYSCLQVLAGPWFRESTPSSHEYQYQGMLKSRMYNDIVQSGPRSHMFRVLGYEELTVFSFYFSVYLSICLFLREIFICSTFGSFKINICLFLREIFMCSIFTCFKLSMCLFWKGIFTCSGLSSFRKDYVNSNTETNYHINQSNYPIQPISSHCDLKLVAISVGRKWDHLKKKREIKSLLLQRLCNKCAKSLESTETLLSHHRQSTFISICIEHARPIVKQWGYIRKQMNDHLCSLGEDGSANIRTKKYMMGKQDCVHNGLWEHRESAVL